MRRIRLTLILVVVMMAIAVSPALAQVVVPSSLEPCPYEGPAEAGISDFVYLTPCELEVVSD